MMRNVGYKYHGGGRKPNKKGHRHNCAAVALAVLTGMPYPEARKLREDENGDTTAKSFYGGYEKAGMVRVPLPGRSDKHCTLEQVRDTYGDCIVIMQWWGKRRTHADALVKGKLRGPWNFLERRSKPKVVQVWIGEQHDTQPDAIHRTAGQPGAGAAPGRE